MITPTCFALFCEDIRRETGNRDTIIGVLPALTRLSKIPGEFRRFSTYFRIRLPLDHDLKNRVFITIEADGVSDAQIEDDGGLPDDILQQAIDKAKERNAPFVEVIARLRLDDFPIIGSGQIRAIAIVGGERLVGGFVNVEVRAPDSNTPSAGSEPVIEPAQQR
ncbi:hypothetical protein ABH999_006626 [Bradyrhizobium yuanmingense]|uniref:hypothetical protein n=1 Tax=Bradyrhizobium yuanmingense TaxID=108015 RepID=UPI00351769C0